MTELDRLTGLPVIQSRGLLKADKASADIGTEFINRTSSLEKKLAAIFDNQLMTTNKGEVKAGGLMGLEHLIFLPGNFQGRKGAAAFPVASSALGRVLHRMI
jgi:hypothetical protein